MSAALFFAFVAIVAILVASALAVYLRGPTRLVALGGLAAWLGYAGLLGYFEIVGDADLRPPGTAFLVLPVFLFVFLVLARSKAGARVAAAFPLLLLIGAQAFRVPVELFLHQLWLDGLAPRMLTYEGANFDILVGLSAPLIAIMTTRGRFGKAIALFWSVGGLASLANVAVRALLTAPGAANIIHAEVPNLAIGTFPFTYIPGFFAPLALVLHVLAIRSLRASLESKPQTAPAITS